jgi:hypothetical protein
VDDELGKKTQDTADQLFGKGIKMDPPYLTWKEFDRDLANDLSLFIVGKLYLAVAKKRSKREMSVLGRQIIKKDFTSPGESPLIDGDSPNLYTCLRVAASAKAGRHL